jgi:hypothetical protein
MSRGLGVRQRQFLVALAALEAEDGQGRFPVSSIIWALWDNTSVQGEYEEWLKRRLAEQAERDARRKAYDAAKKAEMTALAEAGDVGAKNWLDICGQIARLDMTLRCAAHSTKRWRREQYRPETEEVGKWGNSLEVMLNPSRVISELKRRGLATARYRGWIELTDAGRNVAANLVPTLNPKNEAAAPVAGNA